MTSYTWDTTKQEAERVYLAGLVGPGEDELAAEYMEELRSLAKTAGGNVVGESQQRRLRPDRTSFLGRGKIDFGTERLNLNWVTKPRKGIGLSASMITNPYIKLGGTLSRPAVELKPLEAVTSTGVAVATLGVSLVAKGMLDRITAEKKVCKRALEEIDARSR